MIDTWTSISDRGLLTESFLSWPGRLVRGGTYLHSNDSLRALIEGSLGSRNFEDLPIHFECIASGIERASGHWSSEIRAQKSHAALVRSLGRSAPT